MSQVWLLLEDMARVLRALHGQGLIHYDVTPGNILRREEHGRNSFVLTDGGLAHVGPVRNVARGTMQFMAPELTEDSEHDHRVDLYSLGLVAFRLLTGQDPFEGGAGEVLKARRLHDAPRVSTLRPNVPESLDLLIADLLARDPNKRPFDASVLLERIRDERSKPVPDFTEAEAIEAATGGPLVGRRPVLKRFEKTVRALAQGLPETPGTGARPIAGLSEPVLLVRGEPGCGATHVVETLLAGAREEGIPAMLLAGRERAADRRGPLRRLVDGLAGLARTEGEVYAKPRLDLRRGEGLGRAERQHARGRALEVFLRTIEETAARTPLVLIVEDYGDLPELAREAINLLSRHLLAKSEHGGRQARPALSLVVDLGATKPDELLIPDAADVEKAHVVLEPLDEDDLEAICQSRFGGLALLAPDKAHIAKRTEGRPALLAGLLSEAARRGDLRFESNAWRWNLADLAAYPINRAVSPHHAEALAALSPDERRVLEQMAQLETALPQSVVDILCERAGLLGIPDTPLLSAQDHTDHTTFALANLGVRRALLTDLSEEESQDRARGLLSALELDGQDDTALERAGLVLTIGDGAAALELLRTACADLSADRPRRLQSLATRLMDTHAPTLETPTGRAVVAEALGAGKTAGDLAERIAAHLDPEADSIRTARIVAETLESCERNEAATELSIAFLSDKPEDALEVARLCATGGRAALRMRAMAESRVLISAGRVQARRCRGDSLSRDGVRASIAVLRSGLFFLERQPARAARLCHAAERLAARSRLRLTRAQALNNLGFILATLGRTQESVRAFSRSVRLKTALGDSHGAAKSQVNLGRALIQSGIPLVAASALRSAIAASERHALHTNALRALRVLASVYDQQSNVRLACKTLARALAIADSQGDSTQVILVGADLAPMLAAVGQLSECTTVLRRVRVSSRHSESDAFRWEYAKARVLSLIHEGRHESASRLARAGQRISDATGSSELVALPSLAKLLAGESGAATEWPRWRGPSHEIGRLARWLSRTGRSAVHPPALPRALLIGFMPGGRPVSGEARRLTFEAILRVVSDRPGAESRKLLRGAIRAAETAGEDGLAARLVATQALTERDPDQAVQIFSDAVGRLTETRDWDHRGEWATPIEFANLRAHLAPDAPDQGNRPRLESLQALAHRLSRKRSLQHGGDTRLASALRRVLAATARMEAGGSLDDLLSDMTRSTIEITEAERSCVVLVEQGEDLTIRVATSASDQREDLSADDLSHTVIHRVIMSRKPLLLHDVYDDEELLGRPSIANLSLRSILCVPMIRGEVLYGVMYADNATLAGSFDKNDLEVLKLFAEQAAVALETNRLVTDLQTSMDELKAMQDRLVKGERLRVIGEMSSGVAHEFNNLLTSILARVQLLNLNYLAPELKKDLGLIEKACLDAAEVVRRLQSFSKRERQGTFRPVDVSEVCRDGVEFLRPLWSTRRRQGRPAINVRLEADAPQIVQGDPTELREVLTNLVKNALDALLDGGSIVVRSAREDGQVRVTVTDDGPGIPPEVMARVCEPFFTTKGERGTGLGLCLSQQIVERHGGKLEVTSEPGQGTQIVVTLPCREGSESDLPVIEHPSVAAAGGGARVLVIDDDRDVRDPLCTYLRHAGYDVTSAASAEEALASRLDADPGVVVSDVGMPGMDGLELCRRLQTEAPELPVILMSGWASGINPAEARRAGAQALLAKPFAMQQVTELIENLLSQAR